MRRYALHLAAATLGVAASGFGVPAPAQAAACGSSTGVTVVVDYHQLGGGVGTFCDSSGAGRTADAQLRDAGYSLTYVQRQPGFICRIDGKPADDPCVNTPPGDAYWSLWWSDGTSGKWTYSSRGSASLKVPPGGSVAMSWQGQGTQAPPGVAPPKHAAQPSSSPSTHTTSSPHPTPSAQQAAPSASAAPSDPGSTSSAPAAPTPRHRHASGHGKQKASRASTTARSGSSKAGSRRNGQAAGPADQVASATGDAAGSGSGGLPGWVAPVAIVVLFAGTGAVLLTRRRSSGGG